MARVNIRDVSDRLAGRADQIAQHYYGEPTYRTRSEYRYGKTGKVVVYIAGGRRGRFHNWGEGGEYGDMIDFIAFARGYWSGNRSHVKKALKEALEFLGGGYVDPPKFDRKKEDQKVKEEERKKRNRAKEIWDSSKPIGGTLAETYLRNRGITVDLPEILRFHPAVHHRLTMQKMPALIAGVQNEDMTIDSVWRIFLQESGDRYRGGEAKMGMGKCLGGAIRLTPPARRLYVTEGVETALSFATMAPGAAVWAARAWSFYKKMAVPSEVKEIVFLADGDNAGRDGAIEAAESKRQDGLRSTAITAIPDGWDINDLIAKEGGQHIRAIFFNQIFSWDPGASARHAEE